MSSRNSRRTSPPTPTVFHLLLNSIHKHFVVLLKLFKGYKVLIQRCKRIISLGRRRFIQKSFLKYLILVSNLVQLLLDQLFIDPYSSSVQQDLFSEFKDRVRSLLDVLLYCNDTRSQFVEFFNFLSEIYLDGFLGLFNSFLKSFIQLFL